MSGVNKLSFIPLLVRRPASTAQPKAVPTFQALRPFVAALGLAALLIPAPLTAATHAIAAGEPIQPVLDRAAPGDVVELADGIYHETLVIRHPLTLRAAHPGEATVDNRYPGKVLWRQAAPGGRVWYAEGITWAVLRLLVDGVQAFDYRTKENFDRRECGPYWSKGWQAKKAIYTVPPISFASDAATGRLWLRLADDRDPNTLPVDFNSADLGGRTLVQKDLGAGWNQQQIAVISQDPPEHPITMWYEGTPEQPAAGRIINFPKGCGIVIDIKADGVILNGLRIHMAPTVGVEVNDSHGVVIRDCYFSGYQFAINTGYRCTRLTVEHCEMDGGRLISAGGHRDENLLMWDHSTYVNPIKFNGTGLTFIHNHVYEGFDLFHPRGRHKDFADVPDIPSEVAFNVWQKALDNILEFDAEEARLTLRAHHNLILGTHDTLAITTTENGGPLSIDHNLWWPGGGRIMKLSGTQRLNRGVQFVHNTYFTGHNMSANRFADSVFENNIVISACAKPGWSEQTLGAFFPTRFNLLKNGQRYAQGFQGLTDDPKLGSRPETLFLLQQGSPAIDAGRADPAYHQENVTDGKPDLGATEYGATIEDWRREFGHCGPRWITAANQARKARCRPVWPKDLDPRWGGLD